MSSSLCLMPFRVLLSPAGHDSSSCEIDPNVRAPTILISLLIIGVGSFVWAIPYPLIRSSKRNVVHVDRKARWGVLVQCVGYSILWQSHFWLARPSTILLIASVFVLRLATLFPGGVRLPWVRILRWTRRPARPALSFDLVLTGSFGIRSICLCYLFSWARVYCFAPGTFCV